MIEPFLFSMMCFYGHQKTLRTVLSCQLSPQPQAEFRQDVRNECLKKKTEGGGDGDDKTEQTFSAQQFAFVIVNLFVLIPSFLLNTGSQLSV